MATKNSANKNIIKVGITGQKGFIGSFLTDYVDISKISNIEIVRFDDEFFENDKIDRFVTKCHTIIHLAAKMRGDDEDVYQTSMALTRRLIEALDKTRSKTNLIFSSSIHEQYQTGFGRAKKESRELLHAWTEKHGTGFAGLIIPHVFGPFARPFHNSAVATFCFQLTNNQEPTVTNDSQLQLVYVQRLVSQIIDIILHNRWDSKIAVQPERRILVSELLNELKKLRRLLFSNQQPIKFRDQFEQNLFNTLRSYQILKDNKPEDDIVKVRHSYLEQIIY